MVQISSIGGAPANPLPNQETTAGNPLQGLWDNVKNAYQSASASLAQMTSSIASNPLSIDRNSTPDSASLASRAITISMKGMESLNTRPTWIGLGLLAGIVIYLRSRKSNRPAPAPAPDPMNPVAEVFQRKKKVRDFLFIPAINIANE